MCEKFLFFFSRSPLFSFSPSLCKIACTVITAEPHLSWMGNFVPRSLRSIQYCSYIHHVSACVWDYSPSERGLRYFFFVLGSDTSHCGSGRKNLVTFFFVLMFLCPSLCPSRRNNVAVGIEGTKQKNLVMCVYDATYKACRFL